MSTTCILSLEKIRWKLWGELITQTLYHEVWRTDGQMDGQTDRQKQILMPPDYRHGGIKNTKSTWDKVMFLVLFTSSYCSLSTCEVSFRYHPEICSGQAKPPPSIHLLTVQRQYCCCGSSVLHVVMSTGLWSQAAHFAFWFVLFCEFKYKIGIHGFCCCFSVVAEWPPVWEKSCLFGLSHVSFVNFCLFFVCAFFTFWFLERDVRFCGNKSWSLPIFFLYCT